MSDLREALVEARRLCDVDMGISRSSLLDRIAGVLDAALAQPEAVESVASAAWYKRLLCDRDNFIGSKGLWSEFVDSLPKPPPPLAPDERMRRALEKIAGRHVTIEPLWWQTEAREALRAGDNHAAVARHPMDKEIYYLESILRQMREYHDFIGSCETLTPSIGGEVLADDIDWLDCHIDQLKHAGDNHASDGRELTDQEQKCVDAALFDGSEHLYDLHASDGKESEGGVKAGAPVVSPEVVDTVSSRRQSAGTHRPSDPTPPDQPPFEFDRYINGRLMAEGVTVERAKNFADACIVASRIASRGPNGEVPVLVLNPTPQDRR